MSTDSRRTTGGLGRGLTSLIPAAPDERPREVAIRSIQRNPYQPRGRFDAGELQRLAASIAEHGVLQPVLLTLTQDGYELVAGERRVRAAEMIGLERIPAVVRSVNAQQQLALALVENLQRADLNAMDEAHAFHRLAEEFGLTQEEIATRVGRSRPAISNTLRLLDATPAVQAAVTDGQITEGHARALVGIDTGDRQDQALALVMARALSVRETERLVRQARDVAPEPPPSRALDPDMDRLEAGLRSALGTKVTLRPGRRGGRITIEYYDPDDLTRLYERLTGTER